jgi:hypothetical protein
MRARGRRRGRGRRNATHGIPRTEYPGDPDGYCTFLGADVGADATAQGTSYSTAGATADPHDLTSNVGDACAPI